MWKIILLSEGHLYSLDMRHYDVTVLQSQMDNEFYNNAQCRLVVLMVDWSIIL